MSHDERKDDTPIPTVHLEAVERELQEFLRSEAKERSAGFTKENVIKSLGTLTDAFARHVKEDQEHHRKTDETLRKHGRTLSAHESRLDDMDKTAETMREAAKAIKEAAEAAAKKAPLSIPPMRNVEDTGSYNVNQNIIEEAKAVLRAMELKNTADLQAIRDAQTSKELAEKTAIIVELREDKKWWEQNRIQWLVAGIGGFLAIVTTAVVTWLVGKEH